MNRRNFLMAAAAMSLPVPTIAQSMPTVAVALAAPLTGPNARYGELMRQGVTNAAQFLSDRVRFDVRFFDDAGEPRQAVTIASMIAADRIPCVIGHGSSATTLAAQNTYRESGITLLAPVNADKLTESPSPFVYRIIPANRDYAVPLSAWINADADADADAHARVAIIHDNTDYGRDVAEGLRRNLRTPPVLFAAIMTSDTDFSAIMSRIRREGATAVALTMLPGSAIRIMKEAAAYTGTFYMHSLGISGDMMDAGPRLEGTKVVAIHGSDPDQMSRQDGLVGHNITRFNQHLRTNNINPDVTHLVMASALQIVAQAVLARQPNRSAFDRVPSLRGINFDRLMTGLTGFTPQGEPLAAQTMLYRYIWRNGVPRLQP